MRHRPIAFSARPVTYKAACLVFIEEFSFRDDFGRSTACLAKRSLIIERFLHRGGGNSFHGRLARETGSNHNHAKENDKEIPDLCAMLGKLGHAHTPS